MKQINIREYIKANIIILGLIVTLIVAIILRFKGLTFQSHWNDELWSVYASMPDRNFWSMYDMTVEDVHPPLYQSLLWAWYHAFGFNEYVGRSLSAIIGSLGVFSVYLLGKTFFNKEVGLYAAIIASMNEFLIFYSQEVRSYSLLFLLSTVSYIYLFRVLNDYNKKNFILYLFFSVTLMYIHYFGLFLLATQVFVFIYYFVKDKENRKLLAILAIITSVVLIVSLLPLMEYILSHEGKKAFWIKSPTEWFALDYIKSYVKSQYLEGVFLLMITFSLIYLFRKIEHKTYKTAIIVLLIWIVIGYALPYIRSVTAIPLLTQRNTIMLIPALILLVSYGIYLMRDIVLKIASVGIIIFFSIYQLNYSNYYGKVTKQQWREVLQTIKQTNGDMPIYTFDKGQYAPYIKYIAYNKMLSLNLGIQPISNIEKELENNSLPSCFLVVDSHGDHISKAKTLQDKTIEKVLEIKKHRAKAVIYSYKMNPQKCAKLFYGK